MSEHECGRCFAQADADAKLDVALDQAATLCHAAGRAFASALHHQDQRLHWTRLGLWALHNIIARWQAQLELYVGQLEPIGSSDKEP